MAYESLYATLDRDARSWWYYIQLRSQGQTAEARKLERQTIRSRVKDFREARKGGHLFIGRSGISIHYGGTTVSGIGDNDRLVAAAIRLGVPVIDSRPIPDDKLVSWVLHGPLAKASDSDRIGSTPWGGYEYCPIDEYASLAQHFGAIVHNVDVPVFDASNFRLTAPRTS